jgi:hypothetical protein
LKILRYDACADLALVPLDAGLDEVHLEVVQPAFRSGPGKRIASITMANIQEAVVQQGLASAKEVQGIVEVLDRFTADSRTILSLPRIFQVWGRKV